MSETILKVDQLYKYFPIYSGLFRKEVATVKAVNGISFHLKKGEVLAIVGESGSGKSTVGRSCIRLIDPTSGEVEFKGHSLLRMSPDELFQARRYMQMIFQDPLSSLNPRKTIREIIGDPLSYHRIVKNAEEQNEKVAHVLNQVGLSSDVMFRYPHEFSGGQQQRLCIGRAIALSPDLIVCDEAVSALDVSVQSQILNLLTSLKTQLGLSYLFISHDLNIVRHISDRVIVMYLGKVMEEAPTEELFSNPKHPYTQALLSAEPKSYPDEKKNRIILKGEIPSPINPPSGCPFRTRCPYAQPICALPPPNKSPSPGHNYYCILD